MLMVAMVGKVSRCVRVSLATRRAGRGRAQARHNEQATHAAAGHARRTRACAGDAAWVTATARGEEVFRRPRLRRFAAPRHASRRVHRNCGRDRLHRQSHRAGACAAAASGAPSATKAHVDFFLLSLAARVPGWSCSSPRSLLRCPALTCRPSSCWWRTQLTSRPCAALQPPATWSSARQARSHAWETCS